LESGSRELPLMTASKQRNEQIRWSITFRAAPAHPRRPIWVSIDDQAKALSEEGPRSFE
jgi:hypothetical protein